jgi:Flp pilus assembly protein CpaB
VKRITLAVVLAVIAIVAVVAPATGAPRSRNETVAYERASGAHLADTVWVEVAAGELPAAQPLAREKSVSITLEDDSGRPVFGVVHQGDRPLAEVCGTTDAPVALVSREPVHVHLYSGEGCADVSVPTSGTITFTFAR